MGAVLGAVSPGRRRAAHGAADGGKTRHGQEHPAAHPRGRVLRRHLSSSSCSPPLPAWRRAAARHLCSTSPAFPVSIVLGVALGAAAGWLLSRCFETRCTRTATASATARRSIVILGLSFLLVAAESVAQGPWSPVSGLLAVDQHGTCAVKHQEPRAGLPAPDRKVRQALGSPPRSSCSCSSARPSISATRSQAGARGDSS